MTSGHSVTGWIEDLKNKSLEEPFVCKMLKGLTKDGELKRLRESALMKRIPESERKTWRSLWSAIDELNALLKS